MRWGVAVALALAPAAPAHAAPRDGERRLAWDERRPRFRPVEYVVTGIAGPIAIAEYLTVPPQRQPHWVGGILFDDAARDALRLRTVDGLRVASGVADGVGVSLVLMTAALDSAIVPLARGSFDVALQTSLMNAESFALGSILTFTLYDTVGRARPAYVDCQRGTAVGGCGGTMTASFPSGHIHEAFTAAGLSCAHHLYGHVYGSRVADVFACTRDLSLATVEALLRVMGERHWMSDVIAGGAIGFAFGFGLPVLLHYAHWSRPRAPAILAPAPLVGPGVAGLSVRGAF